MNGQEQRQHKTVTDALRKELDALAESFDKELADLRAVHDQAIYRLREETMDRFQEEQKTWNELDRELRRVIEYEKQYLRKDIFTIHAVLNYLMSLPWYQRWWCVVSGRFPRKFNDYLL